MRVPPSWPNNFPKILPSSTIALGLWFLIYKFGGGGHKHSSIALSIISHLPNRGPQLDLMPVDLRWHWYSNNKNKMDNKYNAHESSPNHLPHPCVFHKTSPWCQKSWGPLICSKWRKFLTTIESVKIKQVIFVLFILILQLLVTLRLFSNKKFKK